MKINYKKLIVIIIVTFLIGSFFSFFVGMSDAYKEMVKPVLSPPGIVFPIVWSILFLLMSISYYIASENSSGEEKDKVRNIYFIQLIFNSLWTLVFFEFKNYLLAWIWVVILIILVTIMILRFYKVNKLSGLLNIPYLIWLFFALYLSFGVYLLN